MSRLVVLAFLLSGCDILFQLRQVPDGGTPDQLPDTPPGAWREPQPLASLNVAGSNPFETDASLTGNGLEIFFSSDRAGGKGSYDIYRATRASISEPFGDPQHVPELSTSAEDFGSITSDGLTFYVRHGNQVNIERATRLDQNSMFSTFEPEIVFGMLEMPSNVQLSGDRLHAMADGFVSGSGTELFLLSRETEFRAWGQPQRQTLISTPGIDGAGALDADGRRMIFHSDRDDGVKKLFMTSRASIGLPFSFEQTEPIHELSNPSAGDPAVTPDMRIIVFTRDGDLYMSTR